MVDLVSLITTSQTEVTYVFDVRARVDGNDIAVLDAQIVPNNSVYPRRPVIKVVVSEDDKNSVLALLALDQNGIATEELERLHGVVGKRDDGVVIVDGIGHAVTARLAAINV